MGLAVWSSITMKGRFNVTLPGIEAHIPKGSIAGYGRKNGKKFQSKFDGEVKWTRPNFRAEHLEFDGTLAIEPAVSLSFGAGVPNDGGTVDGGEGGGSGDRKRSGKRSGASKSGDTDLGDGVDLLGHKNGHAAGFTSGDTDAVALRAPFPTGFKPTLQMGIYARAETPGFELRVSTKENVDKKCHDGGDFKTAVGVEVDLRVGVFAGLDLPGSVQIDTSWIKTGVKGLTGLMYHVNIWKHCWDTTNTDFGRQQRGIEADIEDGLNKERNNLTAAWYDHEDDQPPANSSATAGGSSKTDPSTIASKSNSNYPFASGTTSNSNYPFASGTTSNSKYPSASGTKSTSKQSSATAGKSNSKQFSATARISQTTLPTNSSRKAITVTATVIAEPSSLIGSLTSASARISHTTFPTNSSRKIVTVTVIASPSSSIASLTSARISSTALPTNSSRKTVTVTTVVHAPNSPSSSIASLTSHTPLPTNSPRKTVTVTTTTIAKPPSSPTTPLLSSAHISHSHTPLPTNVSRKTETVTVTVTTIPDAPRSSIASLVAPGWIPLRGSTIISTISIDNSGVAVLRRAV
ncbi:hypothetical protein PMIN02_002034 [Paraphaeosphaeria minitans]